VFLAPQIRFGQRRTAERNAWLGAQEHDAAPPSLFSEGHGRMATGEPRADNDYDLLACCLSNHRKETSFSGPMLLTPSCQRAATASSVTVVVSEDIVVTLTIYPSCLDGLLDIGLNQNNIVLTRSVWLLRYGVQYQ